MKKSCFSTLLLLAFGGAALAQVVGIPPQPIGLLDKNFGKNLEQDDYFLISGKGKGGDVYPKLVFSAKIKDILPKNQEQRALFVQELEYIDRNDERHYYFQVAKESPLKKLATYTIPAGAQLSSFLPAGNSASTGYKKTRYDRMFFYVPGKGLYCTEGGKAPVIVRAENAKDPTTRVIPGAIRLSSYVADNVDPELQSRIVFAAKDPKKGREPFISAGTAKTSKVLRDINEVAKAGSDPDQFAALGAQAETAKLFFVAKNPDDQGRENLWMLTFELDPKNRPIYYAEVFADSTLLGGKPENLVANGSDLFFTAPLPGQTKRILWHLKDKTPILPGDLEVYQNTDDPQSLTFINEDSSYTALALSTMSNGVRRYARWSNFSNAVEILGAALQLSDPSLITPANNYFYFADIYQQTGLTYLQKHSLADNEIDDITINNGANYPRNLREICLVSNTLYFVADGVVDGTSQTNVLFKLDNDSGGLFITDAEVVRTEKINPATSMGYPVIGAKNLHAVIAPGSGMFRLYFTAPISTAVNASFIPPGSTIPDYGTKPWVTADGGN